MQDDIIQSVLKAVALDGPAEAGAVPAPAPEREPQEAPAGTSTRVSRWTLPGFCAKARVTTSFGDLPVEALRLRDPVKTLNGGFRKVEWVDRIHLDEGFLDGFHDAYPVSIQRGALGPNCPVQTIQMSPGQAVQVPREWSAGTSSVAAELTERPNIGRVATTNVTYYLFHCGEPDLVLVDGVWCPVGP